jgi:hypothetical protein
MSKRPLLSVVLGTLALFSLSFVFCWIQMARLSERLVAEQQSDQLNILRSLVEEARWRALAQAEFVASMPEVQQALKDRDRTELARLVGPIIEVQRRKYGISAASFFSRDNIALLRLEAPEAYGDSVSGYARRIVDTNRSGEPRAEPGFDRQGPSIYGDVPVLYRGEQQGTFELGLSTTELVNRLHTSYGLEAGALFDRQMLEQVATLERWDTSVENMAGPYVRVSATDWPLIRDLLSQWQGEFLREPQTFTAISQEQECIVTVLPLLNTSGAAIGQLVGVKKLPPYRILTRNAAIVAGVACLLALILNCLLLQVVLRGVLIWPARVVAERLQALADGGDPPPAGDLRRHSPVLNSLYAAYESMLERFPRGRRDQ